MTELAHGLYTPNADAVSQRLTAETPAYLIAMGANDALLEADLGDKCPVCGAQGCTCCNGTNT